MSAFVAMMTAVVSLSNGWSHSTRFGGDGMQLNHQQCSAIRAEPSVTARSARRLERSLTCHRRLCMMKVVIMHKAGWRFRE
jgi:hypothetical protein